jgi:hypothetical protein
VASGSTVSDATVTLGDGAGGVQVEETLTRA